MSSWLDTDTPFTRRRFLAASAAVAATGPLALAGDRPDATPTSRPALRFGLVTYLWGQDLALPELIETCEKGRALGLELRTTHAHGVEPSLSKEARREVRQRFADSPVTVVGMGSDERFDHPDSARLAKAIAATEGFLRLSHDVGGTGVKVKPDSFHEGVTRDQTIEQIGRSLARVGKTAADLGQQVRLEVHGQCAQLATIRRIMEVADHPAVRVCWNCNKEDFEEPGIEHNFGLVARYLGDTVHVRNLRHHEYPYPTLFDLLKKARYGGWILLEARGKLPQDRAAALRDQRDRLRELTRA